MLPLPRDTRRHRPPAARRLPPLRLLQHRVLHFLAAHPLRLRPRDHLRRLRYGRRRSRPLSGGRVLLSSRRLAQEWFASGLYSGRQLIKQSSFKDNLQCAWTLDLIIWGFSLMGFCV